MISKFVSVTSLSKRLPNLLGFHIFTTGSNSKYIIFFNKTWLKTGQLNAFHGMKTQGFW